MDNTHTLLALIAPQRSTQYAGLAEALAPHELALSAAGAVITHSELITLGGLRYVRCALRQPLDAAQIAALGELGASSAFFDCVARDGALWLRPIETAFTPALPRELAQARRYKGKTNELFTHVLLNIARRSTAFAETPWSELRVFDPLAGGGTTLFTALMLGASAYGIEKDAQDVTLTAAYMRQFCNEAHIPMREKEERLKNVGKRFSFTVGPRHQQLVCSAGDSAECAKLLNGFKRAHLIVADMPYGIQHKGPLAALLHSVLPAWAQWLEPGGALALSWDATRTPRAEMVAAAEAACPLKVLVAPPYDALAHAVDRVIKRRDVIVMR